CDGSCSCDGLLHSTDELFTHGATAAATGGGTGGLADLVQRAAGADAARGDAGAGADLGVVGEADARGGRAARRQEQGARPPGAESRALVEVLRDLPDAAEVADQRRGDDDAVVDDELLVDAGDRVGDLYDLPLGVLRVAQHSDVEVRGAQARDDTHAV